uniref:exodeoxyribonuclease III n=1 Tax=Stomoxys calcitrans TaxID=35570 RepID=A0A1I8Q9U7_STOCA
MPRANKPKVKKDETPKDVVKVVSSTSEELFDALLKQDSGKTNDIVKNNEKSTVDAEKQNEVTDETSKDAEEPAIKEAPAAKAMNNGKGVGGGRGKRAGKPATEKEEEEPSKKPASKGRGKKATATTDVEVITKETENIEVNGNGGDEVVDSIPAEVKQETVAKAGKAAGVAGRGSKRGAKAAAVEVPLQQNGGDQGENGISEEVEKQEEVAPAKAKGRGGKKAAVKKKDAPEINQEEVAPEEVEAEKKVEEPKVTTKAGGRKKKADDKKQEAAQTTENASADVGNAVDNELKSEPEPPKKKGRAATKKPAAKVENANDNADELPKEEAEVVAKKPTKRGAKEAAAEKVEVEKVPAKRARGAARANNKIEEAPAEKPAEIAPVEDTTIKGKRSRKQPIVEKELKANEEEKPKKAVRGGKRKAEKIDEVVEPKQEKAEEVIAPAETSQDTKTDEKPSTARGGRKRAAPSTNKAKKATTSVDEKVDDDKKVGDEANVLGEEDDEENDEADGSKPSKAKKKKEPAAAPMNATSTLYNKADFDLPPLAENATADSDEPRFNLKISSWNVAGLRSWVKKDGLKFLEFEEPDIFCLQETKCTTDQLPEEVQRIPGYHPYWLCMPGGYAGVAIYSKIMPINVEYGIGNKEFDDVGRIITAEYEKFFLVNVYVPNSGRKLVNLEARMKWEKIFQEFVQKLNDRKPLVICGDMNVSHQEIDLANPKTNTRNAGFTKEERDKMTELLGLGYVDTFRHLYPERKAAYTFWTYMGNARSRNVGWRLDYFLVSQRFVKRVVDNCIRSQCMGSDHCPITLFLKL